MYNQQGNVVFNITRGDTGELLFLIPGTIGQGEQAVHSNPLTPIGRKLNLNEELYFGITEPNQPFEFAIVKKKFDANNQLDYLEANAEGTCWCQGKQIMPFYGFISKINLIPEDTVCLLPGKYYYSIKLKTNVLNEEQQVVSYAVDTIVDKAIFNIV